MSELERLIQEHCPNGVEFKELWELTVWDKKFNTVERYKQSKVCKYNYYLAADLKSLESSNGTVKILTTSVTDLWADEEDVDETLSEGEIVCIPWGGNPIVQYYAGKFITGDNRIATSIDTSVLDNKFLYYCLLNRLTDIASFYRGSGIKHPDMSKVLDLKIPVPPIEVQGEIVRILDNFTELTAELTVELTKELTARKKQYEYYRDFLFINAKGKENITLDKIAENCDSQRKPVTSGKREVGNIPYYGASGIVDYVKDYIFDGDYLLVSEDGANLLARSTPIAFSISGKAWVNNHAHILKFEEYVTRRYVEIYLNSIDLSYYITGGAQPKLNQKNLNKIEIPLPPLDEQKHIVEILDSFDSLYNDISAGLSADIEARQKQYAYYRDKILTFKELV